MNINRLARITTTGVAALFLCATLAACQKEGPAESAGKSIDNSTEKAGEKIERAGEKIQDSANDAKR